MTHASLFNAGKVLIPVWAATEVPFNLHATPRWEAFNHFKLSLLLWGVPSTPWTRIKCHTILSWLLCSLSGLSTWLWRVSTWLWCVICFHCSKNVDVVCQSPSYGEQPFYRSGWGIRLGPLVPLGNCRNPLSKPLNCVVNVSTVIGWFTDLLFSPRLSLTCRVSTSRLPRKGYWTVSSCTRPTKASLRACLSSTHPLSWC